MTTRTRLMPAAGTALAATNLAGIAEVTAPGDVGTVVARSPATGTRCSAEGPFLVGMDKGTYVAECFWPGVSERDLSALDERTQARVAELSRGGANVRYLGSLLLRADEVVLCRFEGDANAVRVAAESAAIPFERILEMAQSPWALQ